MEVELQIKTRNSRSDVALSTSPRATATVKDYLKGKQKQYKFISSEEEDVFNFHEMHKSSRGERLNEREGAEEDENVNKRSMKNKKEKNDSLNRLETSIEELNYQNTMSRKNGDSVVTHNGNKCKITETVDGYHHTSKNVDGNKRVFKVSKQPVKTSSSTFSYLSKRGPHVRKNHTSTNSDVTDTKTLIESSRSIRESNRKHASKSGSASSDCDSSNSIYDSDYLAAKHCGNDNVSKPDNSHDSGSDDFGRNSNCNSERINDVTYQRNDYASKQTQTISMNSDVKDTRTLIENSRSIRESNRKHASNSAPISSSNSVGDNGSFISMKCKNDRISKPGNSPGLVSGSDDCERNDNHKNESINNGACLQIDHVSKPGITHMSSNGSKDGVTNNINKGDCYDECLNHTYYNSLKRGSSSGSGTLNAHSENSFKDDTDKSNSFISFNDSKHGYCLNTNNSSGNINGYASKYGVSKDELSDHRKTSTPIDMKNHASNSCNSSGSNSGNGSSTLSAYSKNSGKGDTDKCNSFISFNGSDHDYCLNTSNSSGRVNGYASKYGASKDDLSDDQKTSTPIDTKNYAPNSCKESDKKQFSKSDDDSMSKTDNSTHNSTSKTGQISGNSNITETSAKDQNDNEHPENGNTSDYKSFTSNNTSYTNHDINSSCKSKLSLYSHKYPELFNTRIQEDMLSVRRQLETMNQSLREMTRIHTVAFDSLKRARGKLSFDQNNAENSSNKDAVLTKYNNAIDITKNNGIDKTNDFIIKGNESEVKKDPCEVITLQSIECRRLRISHCDDNSSVNDYLNRQPTSMNLHDKYNGTSINENKVCNDKTVEEIDDACAENTTASPEEADQTYPIVNGCHKNRISSDNHDSCSYTKEREVEAEKAGRYEKYVSKDSRYKRDKRCSDGINEYGDKGENDSREKHYGDNVAKYTYGDIGESCTNTTKYKITNEIVGERNNNLKSECDLNDFHLSNDNFSSQNEFHLSNKQPTMVNRKPTVDNLSSQNVNDEIHLHPNETEANDGYSQISGLTSEELNFDLDSLGDSLVEEEGAHFSDDNTEALLEKEEKEEIEANLIRSLYDQIDSLERQLGEKQDIIDFLTCQIEKAVETIQSNPTTKKKTDVTYKSDVKLNS